MIPLIVVPGLAVRRYAMPACRAVAETGRPTSLLDPLGWRGMPADPEEYGRLLARRLDREPCPPLLVGLSAGTQAAAHAVALSGRVAGLLLVSPTLEPTLRSAARLVAGWLRRGEPHPKAPTWRYQLHDWRRSSPGALLRAVRAVPQLRLEDQLPRVRSPITVVHADADRLSPLPFAAALADASGARLIVMPDASHSWPYRDPDRFVALVGALCRDGPADRSTEPAGQPLRRQAG